MNNNNIDGYIGYFTGKLNDISCLGEVGKVSEGSLRLFKKMLIFNLLDTLSKSVYSNKGNRERFIFFLQTFGNWSNGERISTPHLNRLLELDLNPIFEELRLYVEVCLKGWEASWNEIPLEKDIDLSEIKKRWPKGEELSLGGIKLLRLNHLNLLYNYRNGLTHEFRELGYGFEDMYKTNEPYYHELTTIGVVEDEADSFEIVYPLPFLVSQVKACISRLDEYLRRNKLNPRTNYRFGTYFFDNLNR